MSFPFPSRSAPQFIRALGQRCHPALVPGAPRMRRLITVGAQHAGVSQAPKCTKASLYCSIVKRIIEREAYSAYAQNNIVQVG